MSPKLFFGHSVHLLQKYYHFYQLYHFIRIYTHKIESMISNCDRIIFGHNTIINIESGSSSLAEGFSSPRLSNWTYIEQIWLCRMPRKLTWNPLRKIIFSYWMFFCQKLSICLLPLSILYHCERKMSWDIERNELYIK